MTVHLPCKGNILLLTSGYVNNELKSNLFIALQLVTCANHQKCYNFHLHLQVIVAAHVLAADFTFSQIQGEKRHCLHCRS